MLSMWAVVSLLSSPLFWIQDNPYPALHLPHVQNFSTKYISREFLFQRSYLEKKTPSRCFVLCQRWDENKQYFLLAMSVLLCTQQNVRAICLQHLSPPMIIIGWTDLLSRCLLPPSLPHMDPFQSCMSGNGGPFQIWIYHSSIYATATIPRHANRVLSQTKIKFYLGSFQSILEDRKE